MKIPAFFLSIALLTGCASAVKVGMTKPEVVARLGPPARVMAYGGGEVLVYPKRWVAIGSGGRVQAFPPRHSDPDAAAREWANDMRIRGLISREEYETFDRFFNSPP